MVGILLCAFLIVLNNQEFGRQLLSFMIFIGAGSVALFGSLGAKNPSRAIALVALLTPFWTFYCIISLVNGDMHGGVPGQRGHLRLRHPGDAGSGRRRLRHRPGPHQCDPGMKGFPILDFRLGFMLDFELPALIGSLAAGNTVL